MTSRLKAIFRYFLDVNREERLKVLFLTLTFFFVIGGYTVAKELKDSIFGAIVGVDYQPKAKMISMLVLIPAIFFYSRLVDLLRRHQLLYFYSILYSILGLFFAYFIGHPTIGLANTDSSPYRLFGWLFYFFIEGYTPFVVSVFWAFANSITSPEAAKNNYTLMVSGSKLGGMLSTLFAWWLLSLKSLNRTPLETDVLNHQILIAYSSICLILVPFIIGLLIKFVPRKSLHGYEAAYQIEKEKHEHPEKKESAISSMFAGFILLVKTPYVLGIFAIGVFYELIYAVFNFERLIMGKQLATTTTEYSAFLFEQVFWTHLIGFFIVLLGVRPIINFLGERRSLLIVPIIVGLGLLMFMTSPTGAILYVFILIRSLNYAFTQPLRESLYTITVKDVQFKSKSWIDGFGTKFSKTCGSTFNDLTKGLTYSGHIVANSILFTGTIIFWLVTAFLLGKRFDKAIANNEVIGESHKVHVEKN
ncbi:hypothetical protein M1446_01765 [Candidatus Dependentiae bacterium]|nr:hypothetical protein [Candidatus Dependentiae bacterium]